MKKSFITLGPVYTSGCPIQGKLDDISCRLLFSSHNFHVHSKTCVYRMFCQ